jgi:8-oxo-dGTP diphosphatase
MIYLVRHGKAGSRSNWRGPDSARPLTPAGSRQADAIAKMLGSSPVTRIVSSPYLRCRQTVEPLAAELGIPVEADEALAEGASLGGIHALIDGAERGGLVLCSHGDVIGDFLERVADNGAHLDDPPRIEKGSVWEFEVRNGKIHRGRYHLPT